MKSTTPLSVARVGTLPREISRRSPRFARSGASSILAGGKASSAAGQQLRQRLDGVAQARLAVALDDDFLLRDGEAIAFAERSAAQELDARTEVARSGVGLDGRFESGALADRLLERPRGGEIALTRALGKDQGGSRPEPEGAFTRDDLLRRGEKRRDSHGGDSNNLAPLTTVEYARRSDERRGTFPLAGGDRGRTNDRAGHGGGIGNG